MNGYIQINEVGRAAGLALTHVTVRLTVANQADTVIAAYAPFVALEVWREQEGWVALAGRTRIE